MIKIDHIAIYVDDLEKNKNFFIQYFEAKSNEGYYNPKTGLKTYFLSFSDGSRIEIMNRPDMKSIEKDIQQKGYIHLAFSVGSRVRVDELSKALSEAGYEILNGPRVTGDGYYECSVYGPENNILEITE